MQALRRPWGMMHFAETGPKDGPMVVFGNSLGTELRLWDGLLPHLPEGLRLVRYDKPGHGLSDLADSISIQSLAGDAAALIDHLGGNRAVYVGLSIGGLIGQSLAALRPDLLTGLVLSNTATKIGTAESWQARIAAVEAQGLGNLADGILERWFSPGFRAQPEIAIWRNMLSRTPTSGYVAACRAIAAADQSNATSGLALPVLAIGGSLDGSTPPELVAATAKLVKGSRFEVLDGAGHLPFVEQPRQYAHLLAGFFRECGHEA